MKKLIVLLATLMLDPLVYADEDLGNLSSNPYASGSTSNPYGAGSPYLLDSPNNEFGSGWEIVHEE